MKILQEMGMPDHLTCLLRNLYAGQKGTFSTGHGTTCPNWERGQGCLLLPCYLTYMQSTSSKMLGWMKQAGIKMPAEISTTSDMKMTPP